MRVTFFSLKLICPWMVKEFGEYEVIGHLSLFFFWSQGGL